MKATTSNRAQWTADEIAILTRLYPTTPAHDIAARLGRPRTSVYNKAWLMGIKKDAECLASQHSARPRQVTQSPASVASRFKPGMTPWNKGMKGLDTGGKATRFKPGQRPHTELPIGSYRLNREGHLQRKINNLPGNSSVRWRGVAELVWREAYGPLPKGHRVVFKPGRFSNRLEDITLDAVECVSFAEMMRRNSRHNLPPEVNQLVALKSAITRQVNRITREHQEQPQPQGATP